MNTRHIYYPKPPLNLYIEKVWVAKDDQFGLTVDHHAGLFTELIFNYGDKFQVLGENTESFSSSDDRYIISGLKTSPFRTSVAGRHQNVGFILKPNCYRFLVENFASSRMKILSEILFENLILPELPRFDEVHKYLLRFFQIAPLNEEFKIFERYISSDLMRGNGLFRFNELISMTQKTFIDKFRKFYFLTPSQFVRLKQVNYATNLIRSNQVTSLSEIGMEAGFYDQSHFIRIFKKHHGCTPKQYRSSTM